MNNVIICNTCRKVFETYKGLANHVRGGCNTIKRLSYVKNCPICGDSIYYERPSKFSESIKNGSRCGKCTNIGRKVSNNTKKKLSTILKEKYKSGIIIPNMLGAHSKESREKMSLTKKGKKLSESHKQKIRESILSSEKYKEAMKSGERSIKLAIANRGRKHSIDIRHKMSLNHSDVNGYKNPFYNKTHSAESRRKMRVSFIKRILSARNNGYQTFPNYNTNACEHFDKLIKETGCHIQHALNGGEFYIEKLGYWVDGYDKENNVVYEWDERQHFNKDGTLKDKDILRENEIKTFLNCKFIRIKDPRSIFYNSK